jgi:hypothetical protein
LHAWNVAQSLTAGDSSLHFGEPFGALLEFEQCPPVKELALREPFGKAVLFGERD